jgi:choline dehydrogenase-like flavoprotein
MDLVGLPKAEISWAPSEEDCANLERAVDAFEVTWKTSPLAKLGEFVRRPQAESQKEMRGVGIYHPCGSTRMAKTPDAGVVGPDLRLFYVKNVSVVATSVLPTAGGANPTMMLMMLALRCADNVAQDLLGARQIPPLANSICTHNQLTRSHA